MSQQPIGEPIVTCEKCQMRVAETLATFVIGVRGGDAFRCAACLPIAGETGRLAKAEIVRQRKEKLGAPETPPRPDRPKVSDRDWEMIESALHVRWGRSQAAEILKRLRAASVPPDLSARLMPILTYIRRAHGDWSGVEVLAFLQREIQSVPPDTNKDSK